LCCVIKDAFLWFVKCRSCNEARDVLAKLPRGATAIVQTRQARVKKQDNIFPIYAAIKART
jgi:hypothetical protein